MSPANAFNTRARRSRHSRTYCGCASATAMCRCHRCVNTALQIGRVRPDALVFAEAASSFEDIRSLVRRIGSPSLDALTSGLPAVHGVLYLLFNEGYLS